MSFSHAKASGNFKENYKMTEQQNFTFIKSDKKLIKLNFDDILFVKGLGNYVEIFVRNNKKYIYYKTLKELIDKLPDEFMRVHNSNIVNLKNVDYIEDNHLIIGENKIVIAKSHKDCLLKSIDKLLL
ncbi:LytTR family DNA-binding domain-containing protein [Flavobacterium sp. H122]|uniref:LytR/AlgR family response regulator transcription factor n=1 Tax=Flavobacterium sp. H122 TaxID=2529860 RepID=UPI0020C11082|nr:LytTR family DNA-binding domain-containing protein [Flavobacterium sp. H122]